MKKNELIKLVDKTFFSKKKLLVPYLIILSNLMFFSLTLFLTFTTDSFFLKLTYAILNGLSSGLCFVVSHDLCHGALFKSKLLNEFWGRILFLPSMTAFSLWRLGHNIKHHNFTGLKQIDYPWSPLNYNEYVNLSPMGKMSYRLSRSFGGHWFYWLKNIWWETMFFPKKNSESKQMHFFDSCLSLMFLLLLLFLNISFVLEIESQFNSYIFLYSVVFTIIVPFITFCHLTGFVTYIQHTNTRAKWYDKKEEWSFYKGAIESTVHVKFPKFIDFLFHRVMHHNAHHVNASIPMHNLVEAQKDLKQKLGPDHKMQEVTFTIREYLKDCYQCKLYDYDNHKWYSFKEAEELFANKKEAKERSKSTLGTKPVSAHN